jgi:hypothetical protein
VNGAMMGPRRVKAASATCSWIPRAWCSKRVHTVDVMDRDGVPSLLPLAEITEQFPRLTPVWLDAGYNGKDKGKNWIAQRLAGTAQIVQPPPKPRWVWAPEGAVIDWAKILPPPGFHVLPRRWVVEITPS